MLWFYRLLFLPALLVAAPYYLLRMKRRGGYSSGFGQRFGAVPALPPKRPGVKRIWLQAVSVGEMLAIGPVLEGLKRRGDVEIYLTTTTSTGAKIARDRYAALTVGVGYFPIDAWPCAARAWRAVAPDLAILTEGERWPEHLAQARRRGVPVVCVNARLSDRSFRRMRAWRGLVRPLLGGITRVLAGAEHDAARFRELGFPAERVVVTGNIKLDVAIVPLDDAARARLRRELGLERASGNFGDGGERGASVDGDEKGGAGGRAGNAGAPAAASRELVLLGSSTWPGEEAALVNALRELRAQGLPVRLLLVPRHAERRGEIEDLLETTEFSFHLRSTGAAAGLVDVAVGDTTGELRAFTQLADVVFVGKSLAPHTEGQTPVEAAALGRALVFGQGMSNFKMIAQELTEAGAARVVSDEKALGAALARLFQENSARAAMGAAALAWQRANQGAVKRTLAEIDALLAARR